MGGHDIIDNRTEALVAKSFFMKFNKRNAFRDVLMANVHWKSRQIASLSRKRDAECNVLKY